MKKIAILIADDCLATSITGPQDLFSVANNIWQYVEKNNAENLFDIQLVSHDGKAIATSSGIVIQPHKKLADLDYVDFLLIAAYHYDSETALMKFVEQQRVNHSDIHRLLQSGAMIGAYCSATFVLADTGLLNHQLAVTSWWLERLFLKQYPLVSLTLDKLVVESNRLWTAGATSSYLNLCTKIVEKLCGQQLSNQLSKVMLVNSNRLSQLPYMQFPLAIQHQDMVIAKCQEWIQSNLSINVSLEDMANKCAMSKRNFIRRFKKAVGETPAFYLQKLRIEAAKRYLESTNLKLEQIIEKVGYEDSSAFRRVFQKQTSLTPTGYRNKFSLAQ